MNMSKNAGPLPFHIEHNVCSGDSGCYHRHVMALYDVGILQSKFYKADQVCFRMLLASRKQGGC